MTVFIIGWTSLLIPGFFTEKSFRIKLSGKRCIRVSVLCARAGIGGLEVIRERTRIISCTLRWGNVKLLICVVEFLLARWAQAEFPRSASQNSLFSSGHPGNLYSQVTIILFLLCQNPLGRITYLLGVAIHRFNWSDIPKINKHRIASYNEKALCM